MSRIYLNKRDTATPAKAGRATVEAITDWQEQTIKNALGQRYRSSMRVSLRRPWWMPNALYQALVRSVVVETQAERKK